MKNKFKTNMLIIYIVAIIVIIFSNVLKDTPETIEVVAQRNNSNSIITAERVFDNADLLTDAQENKLSERIKIISAEKQLDIVLLTDDTKNNDSLDYADIFYDSHDFGYEDTRGTGILFFIDMYNRVPTISTSDRAIKYFTDSKLENIWEKTSSNLKSEKYYEVFNSYLDYTEKYMNHTDENFTISLLKRWYIQLIICAILTFIILFIMIESSFGNDTTNSETYLKDNTFKKNLMKDNFVRTHTTSRKIEESNESSTHTSSNGETHGGGSGNSF